MPKQPNMERDPEILAISAVFQALRNLDPDAQSRVLGYVAGKLRIAGPTGEAASAPREVRHDELPEVGAPESATLRGDDVPGELEGISPVARKWMARNGLQAHGLSSVFSLGVDEIDLIAKTVPGKNKKERMRSVFLLKGVAAYLGTGAARFAHEQLKEACLHYDAFDANNFAVNFKSLASEVAGSKDTGYSLTARGVASATEMVKAITQANKDV